LLCIDSVHPTQATKVTAGWIRNTRISWLKPPTVLLAQSCWGYQTWAFSCSGDW
jgi:hypothetical protein